MERPGKNKKSDTIQYNILPNLGDKELFDVKDTLRVQFMDSIWKITETNIRLYEEDRLDLTAGFNYKSDKKQLQIIADWKMNTNYTLVLLENFAVDSTRKTMLDTTRFKTMNIGDYGSAVIEIEKELIRKPTLISLYKNDVLVQSQSLKDTLVVYNQLAPGNYSLRLLYDENNNGLWDTGNFYERKLPEISLELPKPILIKSNWENRIIWQKNPKKLRK